MYELKEVLEKKAGIKREKKKEKLEKAKQEHEKKEKDILVQKFPTDKEVE